MRDSIFSGTRKKQEKVRKNEKQVLTMGGGFGILTERSARAGGRPAGPSDRRAENFGKAESPS